MYKISNSFKLVELLVSLEERVLHYIFRVFAILRNVLRDPKDLPVIFTYQCVVRGHVARAHPFNKGDVGMLLVLSWNRSDVRMGVGCGKSTGCPGACARLGTSLV